ncbi:flippase-like domain-containing protein [bacterium]|nr:flippase-like domain-containing protein [bacterium]
MRKTLFKVLKILVSIGLLVFLVHRAGLSDILLVVRSANVVGLLVALFVYTATIVLISWRWRLLLVSQQAGVPFGRLLSLYFIGFFFNNFLPSSIGGDIYRAMGAGQENGRKAVSAASVLVERLMGMLGVSALAILAVTLVVHQEADGYLRALVLGFGAIMILLLVLFFNRRTLKIMQILSGKISLWNLGQRLLRFYEALTLYRKQKGVLALVFFISIGYQLMIVVFSYLVGFALDLGIPLRYFMLCVPVTVIISLVPISINGLGVRETGYVFLLSKIGHSSSEAVSLSLLIYGLSLLASLVGGILYLLRGTKPLCRSPQRR